jgi:HPt (histidine-containing phosphotransfer) domain-containing protein
VLRILIEATLEEAPRLMASIRAAIDAQDATRLRISAHTLKGALRYFGDTRAYQAAFYLENLAREGSFSTAAETLRQLDPAVAEVVRCMQDRLRSEGTEDASRLAAHARPSALAGMGCLPFAVRGQADDENSDC